MPINEEKRFFSWLQVLDNPISVTKFFILLNLSYICWKAKVISEGLNFFSSHGSRGLRRNFVWGIMWNGNFLYVCTLGRIKIYFHKSLWKPVWVLQGQIGIFLNQMMLSDIWGRVILKRLTTILDVAIKNLYSVDHILERKFQL